MKREARDVAMRFSDPFPRAVPEDLAADRASGVLDERKRMLLRDFDQAAKIAGHADLMHAKYRPGLRTNGCLNQGRVHVIGSRINIDEDGKRSAIAHAVGGRDVGMADGNYLVTKAHPSGEQGEVQRRGAVGHGAGIG